MRLQFYVMLCYCHVICNQFEFLNAKAIIGPNVRQATEREFPFIVSLIDNYTKVSGLFICHFCTGVLVSNRDVLTSAHCLNNKSLDRIRISIGSIDLRFGTVYFPSWWVTYDVWTASKNIKQEFKDNDIAVIRLNRNVPDNIKPAVLSTISNSNLYELDATISGWGKANNGYFPIILETANVKILSKSECKRRAKEHDGMEGCFGKRFLCSAAEPYAQLNFGDSGGPLLYQNQLVAISHGMCLRSDLTFHPEKMNLHFSINYYRDFILDVINH